jgi:putative cell wall-binding protein
LAETPLPETPLPATPAIGKADFSKISGENRVLTAVAVARTGWQSAETVILAPGAPGNIVDALAAAPLAGQLQAPILIGWGNALDPAVVEELSRLGAKKIVATGALSQSLLDGLRARLPGLELEVLRGANRQETAELISQKVENPKGLIIVGYDALADAVSVASWAAANNYLIQPAEADGTFGGDTSLGGYIIGGPALVKDIPGFTRIYGPDRYATNKAVRETLQFEYDSVYTANGTTLVDALTGAALAAQTRSPIILLPGGDPAGVDFTGVTERSKLYSFGG